VEESTRRQINWVIIIGVIAVLIVWGVARSQRLANLQQQLAEALIDYDLLSENTTNPNDPRLVQALRRIEVIRDRDCMVPA